MTIGIFLTIRLAVIAVPVIDQVWVFGKAAIFTQAIYSVCNPVSINVAIIMLVTIKMNFADANRVRMGAEKMQTSLYSNRNVVSILLA